MLQLYSVFKVQEVYDVNSNLRRVIPVVQLDKLPTVNLTPMECDDESSGLMPIAEPFSAFATDALMVSSGVSR